MECAATVLDGDKEVLKLGRQPVAWGNDKVFLSAAWSDPVLWGTPPYGEPKLYTLRVELLDGEKVVDRLFTRFGFREVWIEGRDVLLNGKKLWLAGMYHGKLTPLRYLNDRRPMSRHACADASQRSECLPRPLGRPGTNVVGCLRRERHVRAGRRSSATADPRSNPARMKAGPRG